MEIRANYFKYLTFEQSSTFSLRLCLQNENVQVKLIIQIHKEQLFTYERISKFIYLQENFSAKLNVKRSQV